MSISTIREQLFQDLRYALRAMVGNRGFTSLAVLSLALSIGANTAIYSFMDSILLRSLPVHEPEALARLSWHAQPRGGAEQGGPGRPVRPNSVVHMTFVTSGSTYNDPKTGMTGGVFPFRAFELLRDHPTIFSSAFAFYRAANLNVIIKAQGEVINGQYVSGDYFRGLGITPAAGRLTTADDDRPGAPVVAVLDYGVAQRYFGNVAKAIGEAMQVNKTPVTIVGVTPPEFFGVDPAFRPDVYIPLRSNILLEASGPFGSTAQRYVNQNFYWLEIMGRLRPGVTLATAQAILAPSFHQFVMSTATNDVERANLPSLAVTAGGGGLDTLRRQYSKPLYVLLTLVGLVLAIACANIANLLLTRANFRRREFAVRLSVGATRPRIVRQLLTESTVLALLGGMLGLLFAVWGIRFLTVLLANGQTNFTLHAHLNLRVLMATIAISLFTGVMFGLAPAIQSTRVDLATALKQPLVLRRASRSLPRFLRLGVSHLLIVSQVAISVLILVAAGLFVRTLSNLQSIDVGFNPDNVVIFRVNARHTGKSDAELATFYGDLTKRFSQLPGVQNVTLSNIPLIAGGTMRLPISTAVAAEGPCLVLSVGPKFFETMQVPMIRGRQIQDRDDKHAPSVAVVSEQFAKSYFGSENPIGRHIKLGGPQARDIEIVGISRNIRYGSLKEDFGPIVFIPYSQGSFPPLANMTYAMRVTVDALGSISSVRTILRQMDPRVTVSDVKTQVAQINQTINQEITFARLCTAFGVLAMTIAVVGLYGMTSYTVSRRTHELCIRMALGARRTGLLRVVLTDVFLTVSLGLTIGIVAALLSSRLLASFLFGMKPNDSLAFAGAVVILCGSATLAAYIPARRASGIDPMVVLRHE